MRKKMMKRRSAFTLVELLVVIVIIGILSSMLMLTMGSGTDRATATKIVSDLRNLKAAAIMVYADDDAWPTNSDIASLDRYVDQSISSDVYAISDSNDYVGYLGIDTNGEVDNYLKDMAEDNGLYGTNGGTDLSTPNSYAEGDTAVWMKLR
ncbi:MAG: type II secretion system GspH family protein [Synergistales bacterium]|nr:type II secretion system GspH family protein [Synergistales bacterium]